MGEAHLHDGAARASHVDSLGTSSLAGVDVELHLLTIAQRAEALGVNAGLVNEEVLTTILWCDAASKTTNRPFNNSHRNTPERI